MNQMANMESPPPLRELAILKKLEYQHQLLEVKAKKQRKRKFKSHPMRMFTDNETISTTSNESEASSSSSSLSSSSPSVILLEKEKVEQDLSSRPSSASDITKKSTTGIEQDEVKLYSLSSGDDEPMKNVPLPKPKMVSTKQSIKPSKSLSITKPNPDNMVHLMDQKFRSVFEKSLQSLNKIKSIFSEGIILPDGEEECQKRNVRVKEFSNRFSRNYLYPLSRQLKELPKHLQFNNDLIMPKLLSVYQVILNALQTFQNHLPTAGGEFNHNQFRILMTDIIEVSDFYRNLIQQFDSDDYLLEFADSLKVHAELTLQCVSDKESILSFDHEAKQAMMEKSKQIEKIKKNEKRKLLNRPMSSNKRYSMYMTTAAFRRDAHWRRTVENNTRNKFNVKSKYKTATYKHRPPLKLPATSPPTPAPPASVPQQQQQQRQDTNKKPFQQRKQCQKMLSRSRATTPSLNMPINEDLIRTMVESARSNEIDQCDGLEGRDKDEVIRNWLVRVIRTC